MRYVATLVLSAAVLAIARLVLYPSYGVLAWYLAIPVAIAPWLFVLRRRTGRRGEIAPQTPESRPRPASVAPSPGASGGTAGARKDAAFELGKLIDPGQIARIQAYLEDQDVEVRRTAISSLEQQWPTGDAVGMSILAARLADPDAKVRATAALAIGEFVPCAKTLPAIEAGRAALAALLTVLATESDEEVRENIFIALANVDDPGIVPPFTEAIRKLQLPAIYVGIRSISALRSTQTRTEMISVLQRAEAELKSGPAGAGVSDLGDYHGKKMVKPNAAVLTALEQHIGKPIPIVTVVNAWTFGALIESDQVVELGLNDVAVVALPESLGDLTALRRLWMTGAKIGSLPASIGRLRSLTMLLMQDNDIVALPETIVNLTSLTFLRLDEKAATDASAGVSAWLAEQEKKLGSSAFLWD